jgi:biopolymer transport protein TolR
MAMAISQNGGGGRRRGRGRGAKRPISEINVTPMVDVMLVLLIVFMVAAPMLTVGVPIDLPQTKAKELNTDSKPVTISVDKDGNLFMGEDPITDETLISTLTTQGVSPADDRVYVRADTTANYGAVARVMGLLSGAGYSKIGLMTLQDTGQ